VELAADVRGSSGVVVLPTETFYGLAADPGDAAAVERVRTLKGRPAEMGLPVLAAGWDQVEALVEVPDRWREPLDRVWPGPLTAVLPARSRSAAATRGTLAVRVPGLELLRRLLAAVGPLTGTSANRHGLPAADDLERALASILGSPDGALDGGRTSGGLATTLVDLTAVEARVLRQGEILWGGSCPVSRFV
jgi:L-threonylcarbamoyladenylate synthase